VKHPAPANAERAEEKERGLEEVLQELVGQTTLRESAEAKAKAEEEAKVKKVTVKAQEAEADAEAKAKAKRT
jgi:hypothetical protein